MIDVKTFKGHPLARIDLGDNLSLLFENSRSELEGYPNNRIRKGLIISYGNNKLCEEGVGFGVPIIKTRSETIFPGDSQINLIQNSDIFILSVNYNLNLVNRMKILGRRIDSETFYRIKEWFSSVHREHAALRGIGANFSNVLRRLCGIRNFLEVIPSSSTAQVNYTVNVTRKTIQIDVDLSSIKIEGEAEITIANEQGANFFAQYQDSNGTILLQDSIGTWDEVSAGEASLVDSVDRLIFSLRQVQGAKLYRGRELVTDRLAWSGINYVLSDHSHDFHYDIKVGGLK